MYRYFPGIPLGLVTFQSVGERINHCIKVLLQRLDVWLRRSAGVEWLGKQIKTRHLLCVSFSIGCITIAVASLNIFYTYAFVLFSPLAGVFHQRERWTIFDS